MSHPPFPSVRTLLHVCVALLICSTPPVGTAHAGIGNLAKKAKQKAAQAAGAQAPAAVGDKNVEFNDVIVELTNERLERIVAAFSASKAAAAGRPALVEKLNQATREYDKHLEKHGDAISALRNKRGDVEVCLDEGYRQATDRRMQEYSQRALTDPALLAKFSRAAQEHNAAAARGDSAAIKALQQTLHSEVLPTREDSLAVQRNCGPLPPRTPAEDRLDALDKQMASLSEQIRDVDKKVAAAQAAEGRMEEQQFAMATERIEMYLAWRQSESYSKSATRGFTEQEIETLEKHLEKLRAALR